MKKLLAGLLALCVLLALSACGENENSEVDQETGTYPEGMDGIYVTEAEENIDFGEKDFFGDLDFEEVPNDGDPLEDI